VNDELVLTESVAILYYIARCAPESGLLPNASMDVYARLDELACFVLAELEQPLWSKGKHMFALPEEQRIPELFETAKFEFAKAVTTLDHLLPESEFAVGNSFTLVDILLAQTFNWAIRFEFELPEHFVALRNRHYERPAAKRAIEIAS
jgi:glutathione S-transferase